MSSRISLFSTPRLLAFRPRLRHGNECFNRSISQPLVAKLSTKNELPVSADKKGPNTDTLPSISEEAASISKAKGEKGPELEQGTPVQEIFKRDKEALENAPKSIKDEIKKQEDLGKRSFSTLPSRRQDMKVISTDPSGASIAQTVASLPEHWEDPLPPLKPEHTLVGRYPAIIDQFVGLIMRDGKKGVAQQV
jgi:small subunit ribosomal protein S7